MPMAVQGFKSGIQTRKLSGTSVLEESYVGSIRRLLQDASQEPIDLKKLRNLLLHVAGLLSQLSTPHLPGAMQVKCLLTFYFFRTHHLV